jgi:hypothetical protein
MSFRLTPGMTDELRAGLSPIAPLIQADLPDYTLRHLVGAGEVMFGGQKFVGRDDRFGALIAAGNLKDGMQDEAPDWDLTFAPPSTAAVSDLTAAEVQGSRVKGWLGVIDRTTGLLLPEPVLCFVGKLDYARLRIGHASRTVEWRCVSALEVFHDAEIGARLSDAWHKLVWPGETGCANMSGLEKTSYWGVENPPSSLTYAQSGGYIPRGNEVYQ